MDKSVPAGAALLLDFIARTEVSRTAPECYEVIYGHNQLKLAKPLTSMTLGEVVDAQKLWSKRYGSSASGAYQFMRATLQGLSKELGLNGNQLFDGDFQDRLGYHLLKRRGYEEFMSGNMSLTEFGKRLAQEWASFPVLVATKGQKREVARGQSYYAGDGLNKALVKPETVEAVLAAVKLAGRQAPKPAPVAPQKAPTPAQNPSPNPSASPTNPATRVKKKSFLSGIIDALLLIFRPWR